MSLQSLKMNLKEREIFDEKIKISILSGMIDASKFREIPDNQYVWIVQGNIF
jgi:hypothetical protein